MTINIKILKTPGCGACKKSINAIESVQDESDYDIEYEEINLVEQPEYAKKYKIMAAPGIVINDKLEFVGGVSKNKLRKKLDELKK